MGFIYITIWGAGKSILWLYHVYRFGDFFGGGMPSFIGTHLPIHGISHSTTLLCSPIGCIQSFQRACSRNGSGRPYRLAFAGSSPLCGLTRDYGYQGCLRKKNKAHYYVSM